MESNPYLEARREWDERYADLVLGKRNWQIAAGGLLPGPRIDCKRRGTNARLEEDGGDVSAV